ncbi:MAG: thioredoxin family protein [Fimbriimonadaceae bacterium]
MKIQILGTGCANCKNLQRNAEAAVRDIGLDAQIEKVEDLREIMKMGVMSTPGLAVDGTVVSTGRVPSVDEIKAMLKPGQA